MLCGRICKALSMPPAGENRRLEIILKDISTVQYHPERLTEFGKTALEMVQN